MRIDVVVRIRVLFGYVVVQRIAAGLRGAERRIDGHREHPVLIIQPFRIWENGKKVPAIVDGFKCITDVRREFSVCVRHKSGGDHKNVFAGQYVFEKDGAVLVHRRNEAFQMHLERICVIVRPFADDDVFLQVVSGKGVFNVGVFLDICIGNGRRIVREGGCGADIFSFKGSRRIPDSRFDS